MSSFYYKTTWEGEEITESTKARLWFLICHIAMLDQGLDLRDKEVQAKINDAASSAVCIDGNSGMIINIVGQPRVQSELTEAELLNLPNQNDMRIERNYNQNNPHRGGPRARREYPDHWTDDISGQQHRGGPRARRDYEQHCGDDQDVSERAADADSDQLGFSDWSDM